MSDNPIEISREAYLLSVVITGAIRCVDTLYSGTEQEPELVNQDQFMRELMAHVAAEVSPYQLDNAIGFLEAVQEQGTYWLAELSSS